MDLRRIVRNISSQWLMLIAQLAVSVVMTPFLVRRLGKDGYGVIVIVSGLLGYSGILYLGLGAAIVKYVAEHNARDEQAELNETVSTLFTVYLAIGAVCLAIALGLVWPLPAFFNIAQDLVFDARVLVALLGVALFVQFPGSVYTGVLMGLQRYDAINYRLLALLVVRTAAIVVAALRWPSVLVVGSITMVSLMLDQLVAYIYTRTVMPGLRISPRLFRRGRLRELFGFSAQSFLFTLSERLINQTDEFVIGNAINAGAVTLYAVPLRLVDYARDGIDKATHVLMPGVSDAVARKEFGRIRQLWETGNKAVMVLVAPVVLVFIAWGHELLVLWMEDPDFGTQGYVPLVLLALAFAAQIAGRGVARPLFEGMGAEALRVPARITIVEGAANLALSVVLVRRYGITGVALGTLIPAAISGFVVMPWYTCRRFEMSYPRHVWNVFVRTLPPLVPAYGVLWVGARLGMQRHLATAAVACLAVLVVYLAAALFVTFDRDEREVVLRPIRNRLRPPPSPPAEPEPARDTAPPSLPADPGQRADERSRAAAGE